jgi:hypothetical protein
MGLGGLAIRPSRAAQVERDIAAINDAMGATSEVKWEKARQRRDDVYRAYIDLLASLVAHKQAHLHLRFSPIAEYDHSLSGPRKHADTVGKAFYQLLLYRTGRYYSQSCKIVVRPDNGPCTEYLPKMLPGLVADCGVRFGPSETGFASISPADSVSEPILQLVDVTLGALTCIRNGNHENGTVGGYKADLATYALKAFGLDRVDSNSPIEQRHLNVWDVVPSIKNAAPKR